MKNRTITILGAGLVGSVLSVLLRKRGYDVTVYERRPDMRKETISAGRSINLAMSNRGWKALELAGLRDSIESIAIPMKGRQLHQADGSSAFQAYGKNDEAIYSVSRGELNKRLMDLAEECGVNIIFNKRCSHVDVANNIITLTDQNDNIENISCDLLFAADGAFSSLRTAYSLMDRVDFSQMYIEHGYKELSIPPGENGSWLIEKNALHIWPRKNYMLIALPNIDGSFTCTLFFPFEGKPSFDSLKTDEDVLAFFQKEFPDAVTLMPTLLEDYRENPSSSLITVRISPWHYKNKSCLIGDAAHGIVPFYGQGMNAGFEDCSVLMELLDQHNEDWDSILPAYDKARKPNGDAVADLALLNFIEMRDKVADPHFLERKKIEKDLGLRFAGRFNSVYEMVSFSHTPYSYALKCMEAQDVLLKNIMAKGDYFTLINDAGFVQELEDMIAEYEKAI